MTAAGAVRRLCTGLVLGCVMWASLVDCPYALDLIEDGLCFETSAGPLRIAHSPTPDRNDPLAVRLGHRVFLGRLQERPAPPRPSECVFAAQATDEAPVPNGFADSTGPRAPPAV